MGTNTLPRITLILLGFTYNNLLSIDESNAKF
jgi:hypothetical protein